LEEKSLKKQFDCWKKENDQHGRQAFSRFMMLKFLDAINDISDEFVFKGGNLLWHYIKTPRQTIDLDLTTIKLNSHLQVKKILTKIGSYYTEINFFIKEFNEVNEKSHLGASIIIGYKTQAGQTNQFNIDIVYSLPTDLVKMKSTISDEYYQSASIENIVADKVKTAYTFRGGNTRMKDYDDLWRIANSGISINKSKLFKLMKERGNKYYLDDSWVQYLQDYWKRHTKLYRDIPGDFEIVFKEVNSWLKKLERK